MNSISTGAGRCLVAGIVVLCWVSELQADTAAPAAAVPPVALLPPISPGCCLGPCPPVYRRRPTGCDKEKKRIMLDNRLSEPEWYRYYRCQHYGHYPTQWAVWPDGWLLCRYPHPGPHPYDLKQPEPKQKPPAGSRERAPEVNREPFPLRSPGPAGPAGPAKKDAR